MFSIDIQILVLCTSVLYFKFLVTTMLQGRKGFAAGTRPPEDKQLPMANGVPGVDARFLDALESPFDKDDLELRENEMRWKRIVQNDLESIPFAIVVFIVSIQVQAPPMINSILIGTYTIARLCHTVSYAYKQPFIRMLTWLVSVGAVIAVIISMVVCGLVMK